MPTTSTSNPQWYVVQCKSRQDARAEENLRNQHIPCYRPVRAVEAIRHGKRVLIDEALFPGYVFVHLCRLTDSWHTIRSTRGVLRLVTFAHYPVPIATSLIDNIKQRLAATTDQPLFEPGNHVTLTEGPFKDLDAIFSKADGEERVIILLNVLQRQQSLSVPLKSIRAAD